MAVWMTRNPQNFARGISYPAGTVVKVVPRQSVTPLERRDLKWEHERPLRQAFVGLRDWRGDNDVWAAMAKLLRSVDFTTRGLAKSASKRLCDHLTEPQTSPKYEPVDAAKSSSVVVGAVRWSAKKRGKFWERIEEATCINAAQFAAPAFKRLRRAVAASGPRWAVVCLESGHRFRIPSAELRQIDCRQKE